MNRQINSFQNMCDVLKESLTVWPGKSILCKKTPQNCLFCEHEAGLPDFEKPWTTNSWHQVNFTPAPENFGVWRFKLAMWEVGGIKIEGTQSCRDTEIGEKSEFFSKKENIGHILLSIFGKM